MGYYLGVDIGFVNAKPALIGENGKVVKLDSEKIIASPRVAVSAVIAKLALKYRGSLLQEISHGSMGI